MTLLAIELASLNSEPYIPIIKQALDTVESHLYIVVFLSPDLLPKLNSSAKRAGYWQPLQQLISALYVSTAAKPEIQCDIIFADWCGYQLESEIWEYSVLNIPECTQFSPSSRINGSVARNCHEITEIESVCADSNISQRSNYCRREYRYSIYTERSRRCGRYI